MFRVIKTAKAVGVLVIVLYMCIRGGIAYM
jgi:predicted ABC-type ATPase